MTTGNERRHYETGGDFYRTLGDDTVEFWDGDQWERSVLPTRLAFLDDALGSGGAVREVFDSNEVPGV